MRLVSQIFFTSNSCFGRQEELLNLQICANGNFIPIVIQMEKWFWLAEERDDRPQKRFQNVKSSRSQASAPSYSLFGHLLLIKLHNIFHADIMYIKMFLQPLPKTTPAVKILPNLTGVRTDEQFDEFLVRNRNDTVRKIPSR